MRKGIVSNRGERSTSLLTRSTCGKQCQIIKVSFISWRTRVCSKYAFVIMWLTVTQQELFCPFKKTNHRERSEMRWCVQNNNWKIPIIILPEFQLLWNIWISLFSLIPNFLASQSSQFHFPVQPDFPSRHFRVETSSNFSPYTQVFTETEKGDAEE